MKTQSTLKYPSRSDTLALLRAREKNQVPATARTGAAGASGVDEGTVVCMSLPGARR